MKQVAFIMACVAALVAVAQQTEQIQSGTPAKLTTANGKTAKVFLQSEADGKVTFQLFKSTREMTVPVSKISRFEFIPKYDAEGARQAFVNGDYAAVLGVLEPVMPDFEPYMAVENNMQDAFCMLMDSYRGLKNYSRLRACAERLLESSTPALVVKGQVNAALAALGEGNVEAAGQRADKIESDAGKLYVEACILRAQGNPKEAIKTVNRIIIDHANDVDWLAPGECLNARLYLDMKMTNSAINTARQVKNIYDGTSIAADAGKLHTRLSDEVAAAKAKAKAAARERKTEDLDEQNSSTNLVTEATGGNET